MNNGSERRPLSELTSFFHEERRRNVPADHESNEADDLSVTLQHNRVEGGNKQGSLQDIQVEFVRNPERGADFDARHNTLLITRKLIEALLSDDQEDIRALEEEIAELGGFLINYAGEGKQRLESVYDFSSPERGGWLMAETSAIPLDRRGKPIAEGRILGADGQFFVPQDNNDHVPEDFPLLEEHDYVLDGESVSMAIRSKPSSAMLIADIAALRAYSRYGFAAVTEDAAFLRLLTEINKQRENKIQFILAAIAGVKGLFRGDKSLVAPAMEPGLRNWRSLNLHTNRRNARGFLHGKQRNRTVPVELPGGEAGELLVDWYVTVQHAEKIMPNTNIYFFDENFPLKGDAA